MVTDSFSETITPNYLIK